MARKTFVGIGVVLLSLMTGLPAGAQEVVTLALRNGERPSGELIDMNARGLVLQVRGEDRQFDVDDVAVLEFLVGAPPQAAQARIASGQPFVWLRNGQLIDGRLSDIGGTRPLRITIETAAGRRQFPSNEIAQIFMNPMGRSDSGDRPRREAPPEGSIAVSATQPWTDTGISVSRGERIRFSSTGDIMLAANASSGVGGSPAATSRDVRYPVPDAPAGALIGRVGNGRPFLIGANTEPIAMPAGGRLTLGVNDDHLPDNSGSYYVLVTSESRRRR